MINTIKRVALISCLLQPAAILAETNTSLELNPATLLPEIQATTDYPDAKIACEGSTQVDIADNSLTVELAQDVRSRRFGLMFRDELGDDCGMLYVFENNRQRIFTMRNTSMPLDIAFITSTGIISELATMEIGTGRHTSSSDVMYVLEVNAGWFEKNNLQAGTQINFKTGESLQPLSSLISD